MARYLARIVNQSGYGPSQARNLSKRIREVLGSREAIGNLRVTSRALEFDLFAGNSQELESRKLLLESSIGEFVTLRLLDQLPALDKGKLEALREGIQLFNEERFWECHEVLEQIWHPAKGAERDVIQGMILTAAALVHAQKDESEVSLRMLKKAENKLGTQGAYEGIDLNSIRQNIREILQSHRPEAFEIKLQSHS